MRFSFLVASLVYLVVLSGCSNPFRPQPVNAPSPSETATSTGSISASSTPDIVRHASSTLIKPTDPTGLPLLIRTIGKEQTYQPAGSCEVVHETIEIQPTPLLTEEQRTRLNEQFRITLLTLDPGSRREEIVPLEKFVDRTLEDCGQTVRQFIQELGAEAGMSDYAYSRLIEVSKNDHGFLSLRISNYEYTGGAHPNSSTRFLTLDTRKEKFLKLGDLIKQDQAKAFFRLERTALVETYSEALYEEELRKYQSFLAKEGTIPSSFEIETLNSFDRFYLTKTSLVTEYSPYEIGSYAAGFLTTEFPLSQLRSMIRPEMVERLLP